jgi:hypothetical protein
MPARWRADAKRLLRLSGMLDLKRKEAPECAALAELRADTGDLTAHGL